MYKLLTLKNWLYREFGKELWNPSVPGSCTQIHADLLYNRVIPNPFIDTYEKDIQWVGEKEWEYQMQFEVDQMLQQLNSHELVFEGLDTFANVFLNGVEILKTENMFCEHRVDVEKLLKFGDTNTIYIRFESALLVARRLERENGKHICWNGETCRVHIRKAPYHFGWDWGPVIMTCGPYKPVHLQSYNSRIRDFYVILNLSDMGDVDLELSLIVESLHETSATIDILSPSGNSVDEVFFSNVTSGTVLAKVRLSNPQLWYPKAIGEPALHTFKIQLSNRSGVVSRLEKHIGLRTVELVQEPLEKGTSFYFKVNGTSIFCAGSNWIPAHSLLTMLTKKDYTEWLELAVFGNQSMIRVWGGGFYEDDFFYSECDRLGLLVWQDFMFACGQYPGDKKFIASVEREAIHQLRRLRNHACLALFVGNNEDYQIAEVYNLEWDRKDHSGDYSNTNFPARTIYETTLPTLMKTLCPSVPYHPGSPWSGENPTADPTVGDIHQWNVWHGSQEKYQDWYKLGGRFVSEFGMESLPSLRTFQSCISDPDQMYPQSEYLDHHNKADGFERRLALYVIENIKITSFDMDSWIYATQLMQAECLAYAYKFLRRHWKKDNQREIGGALVWQLNDCWPVASWAIVDFYRRPKLAYYAIKRGAQPVSIGMYRKIIGGDDSTKISSPCNQGNISYGLELWGVNSTLLNVEGILSVDLYTSNGDFAATPFYEKVILESNASTEIAFGLDIPHEKCIAYAKFIDLKGKLIASGSDWPQPLKYLEPPRNKVHVEVGKETITLTSEVPVKGVEILLNRDLILDDNGFDLFPGETKVVNVRGLENNEVVEIRYYQSK